MTTLVFFAAVFATALMSAVFGMAGGLLLMGVLAALYPVAAAMVAHGIVQAVSNGWRFWLLRRWTHARALAGFAVGGALAAGGLALVRLSVPEPVLFIALGLIPLLVWLPQGAFALDARRGPDAVAAGLLVTGLNVAAGVSGPLLDVFFQGSRDDRRVIVATKAACQGLSHVVKIAYYAGPAMSLAGGPPVWALALAVPLSMLGTTLGARVLDRMTDGDFRAWTKVIVTAIGAVWLARGVWLLLAPAAG